MSQGIYLAIDLGATKIMAAAITPERHIVKRIRADTPRPLDEGLHLIKRLARDVVEDHPILGIGASAGGPLDYKTGIVSPLHYPEWHNVPLKEIMEGEFGAPFSVDVDTNAAALAEYRLGDRKDSRLLYITISTGMGGGFIVDGNIYRGEHGGHPEIGHQAVPFRLSHHQTIECPCGGRDCLEALVSGTGIRKIYGKAAEELTEHEWEEVSFNIGQGLRNAAALYAPGVIVLGGGVAIGGGSRLIETARTVVEANVKIVPVPEIILSALGYDTALWGAFALACGG